MSYIHELSRWPNFKWDEARISPLLAHVRHAQGRLLGRMESLGFSLSKQAGLRMLTADIVKSSAIEGEHLDAESVRSSIARRIGLDVGGVPSSRNVDGIVEMMLDATQKHAEPLTENRLFDWHSSLFPTGRSGMHAITVGAWRPVEKDPMQVVSGPMGNERVHFEAPVAKLLPKEMKLFLKWFEEKDRIDPVLRAGIAHLWFVTIHPFEDGNGRIGRAIADMALARAEKVSERFYSLSSQIEAERKHYYTILEQTQRGDLDLTLWLEWFLQCLGHAIEAAEQELKSAMGKADLWKRIHDHPVNDRQRLILNKLLDGFEGKLSTSKYARLAGCSEDTALRDIRALLEQGILVQDSGGGRSTSYLLRHIA